MSKSRKFNKCIHKNYNGYFLTQFKAIKRIRNIYVSFTV